MSLLVSMHKHHESWLKNILLLKNNFKHIHVYKFGLQIPTTINILYCVIFPALNFFATSIQLLLQLNFFLNSNSPPCYYSAILLTSDHLLLKSYLLSLPFNNLRCQKDSFIYMQINGHVLLTKIWNMSTALAAIKRAQYSIKPS